MRRPPMKPKILGPPPFTGLEPEPETEMDTEIESEPDSEVIFRPKADRDIPASYSTISQPMQNVADFPPFYHRRNVSGPPPPPKKLGHPDFRKLCSYVRGIAANRQP